MKVLFRSDSSSKIGFGHIKRDLVLAKQYKNVSFACLALKGSLINEIPYPVYKLKSANIYELIHLIKKEKFELLIIDHYDINIEDEKLIKKETKVQILSFDDEIKPHYCDILLNVNAYAKASDYKGLVPPQCEIRCAYTLIRDEFYQEAKKPREKKYDFFICMGGADTQNLSIKLAINLPKTKNISIATSSSNPNLRKLQEFSTLNDNITLFIDHNNIAKLMNQSHKLIITASSLVNEALFLKADFKAICLAKNQEKLALWLKQKGYEIEFISAIKLKNFTQLNMKEIKLVFKWRNDNHISQFMKNKHFSFKEHLHFIKNLKKDQSKKYFLVFQNKESIGVIDFININAISCEFGLYARPNLKGKGQILMDEIKKYAFEILKVQTLKAEVLKDNHKALRLYQKNHFIINDENAKSYYMILQNPKYKLQ